MTMIDTAALPPMPDLACPAWCSADHYSAWRQQLEATSWAQQQDPTQRIDAALLFESAHRAPNVRYPAAWIRDGRCVWQLWSSAL